MVLTRAFADRFAAEWIAAWNAHDVERLLSHYRGDAGFATTARQGYS